MHLNAISVRLLPLAFLLISAPVIAGLWKSLDDIFSAPPLEDAHQILLEEGGLAYLKRKDDVFEVKRAIGEPRATKIPLATELSDGGRLVEIWGLQDVEVISRVDFDNGSGYRYGIGDTLVIRLYCAALVRHDAGAEIKASSFHVLALRNRNNPQNLDDEVALISELQKSPPFTEEERARLAAETH